MYVRRWQLRTRNQQCTRFIVDIIRSYSPSLVIGHEFYDALFSHMHKQTEELFHCIWKR